MSKIQNPFKIEDLLTITDQEAFFSFLKNTKSKDYSIDKSSKRINFKSKFSLGVGSIGNFIFEPITIIGEVKTTNNVLVLRLYNEIRIDTFILALVISIIILITLYRQVFLADSTPFWLNLLILPCVVLFFNYIYYIQEKELLTIVKKDLLKAIPPNELAE